MALISGFADAVRVNIEGRYNMSDDNISDLYNIVSNFNYGLSDLTESGYLMNLIYFLDVHDINFPISYNYIKELWEKDSITFSLNTILADFVSNGLILIRKMQEGTFFTAENINKGTLDVKGSDYYLVINGTKKFKNLINEINVAKILDNKLFKDLKKFEVSEGFIADRTVNKRLVGFCEKITNFVTRNIKGLQGGSTYSDYDELKKLVTLEVIFDASGLLNGKYDMKKYQPEFTKIGNKVLKGSKEISEYALSLEDNDIWVDMEFFNVISDNDLMGLLKPISDSIKSVIDLLSKPKV